MPLDRTLRKRLQEEAKLLVRHLEAIVVLTNTMTPRRRKNVQRNREWLDDCTNRELRAVVARLEQQIAELKDDYGIRASEEEMVELLEKVEELNPARREVYYLSKGSLKMFFDKYEKVLPGFDKLPEHAMIGIELEKDEGEPIGYWWLEAKQYEWMCALYNLANQQAMGANLATDSKRVIKTREALYLATVNAAFFFVEAYLNGLAVDFWYSTKPKLDAATKKLLTEWDYAKQRPAYVSLRDKVVQYPRIILGKQHPPFQENNCPELAFVSGRAKLLRDSVTHASAWPNPKTGEPEKIVAIFNASLEEVERVVDNAIGLVRKIENVIHGDDKRLYWLLNRGPDGFFPEAVFE